MNRSVVCLVALAGFASAASASVIDLRNLPNEFDQSSWGRPNTMIYAQSVIADDINFATIEMRATGANILFNIMITGDQPGAGGLGFVPDFGDVRYNSGQQIVNGTNVATLVNPNVGVANNERLFVVFEAFSYPNSGLGTMRCTEFNGAQDKYLPGEFVYYNIAGEGKLTDTNPNAWGHRSANNEDIALLMVFNNVPSPSSLALLGLGGLLAARRRR